MRTSAPRPLFPEGILTDRVRRRAQMPAVLCFIGNFSEIPYETQNAPRTLFSEKPPWKAFCRIPKEPFENVFGPEPSGAIRKLPSMEAFPEPANGYD